MTKIVGSAEARCDADLSDTSIILGVSVLYRTIVSLRSGQTGRNLHRRNDKMANSYERTSIAHPCLRLVVVFVVVPFVARSHLHTRSRLLLPSGAARKIDRRGTKCHIAGIARAGCQTS